MMLKRYSDALDKIGYNNLLVLPDDMKEALKNTTNLAEKTQLLEDILKNLQRQGLARR